MARNSAPKTTPAEPKPAQLVAVELPPKPTRQSKAPRFAADLLEQAMTMLNDGTTINLDGGEPMKERKIAARAAAVARRALIAHANIDDPKMLGARTFEVDGKGFSYGLVLSTEPVALKR
jgi:hypothetical protein